MKYEATYKQCVSRLKVEGFLKSLFLGLMIGGAVVTIVAFFAWFFGFKGLWLSIGLFFGVSAIATTAFFFLMFQPSPRKIAERMDRAGLDERMITMYEYAGDDSYLAQKQREDAEASVVASSNTYGKKFLPFKFSVAVISVCAVIVSACLAMTIVAGLGDFGVIRSGKQFFADTVNREFYYSDITFRITYEEGGIERVYIDGAPVALDKADAFSAGVKLDGEAEQKNIKNGDYSAYVTIYVEEKLYAFDKWVDENKNEYPFMPNIRAVAEAGGKVLTARFITVPELKDKQFVTLRDNDDKNNGEGGGGSGNGAGSGGDTQHDQVLDGETKYNDKDFDFASYVELAMKYVAEGKEIPAELRAIVETYFGIL